MSEIERERAALRSALIEHGLLYETGVLGLYGTSASFERIVDGIDACIERAAAPDRPERRRFGPLIARDTLRVTGYLDHLPHLLGSVHAFTGAEAEHPALLERVNAQADWGPSLAMTELVLAPAVCHAVYPTLRGEAPEQGRVVDVRGHCFRHEPSVDPARMVSFRMHENVLAGSPDACRQFVERWIERAAGVLQALGVEAQLVVASDPFFGRAGRLMKSAQTSKVLKRELVAKVASAAAPTALCSFNYHEEHFGKAFGIVRANGEPAHTACMGFGLERVALALLGAHGFSLERWPEAVRIELWG
jgi:seryl-tRNA synthetase